jgi:hypothetical protein
MVNSQLPHVASCNFQAKPGPHMDTFSTCLYSPDHWPLQPCMDCHLSLKAANAVCVPVWHRPWLFMPACTGAVRMACTHPKQTETVRPMCWHDTCSEVPGCAWQLGMHACLPWVHGVVRKMLVLLKKSSQINHTSQKYDFCIYRHQERPCRAFGPGGYRF